jgi:hypothetical protein
LYADKDEDGKISFSEFSEVRSEWFQSYLLCLTPNGFNCHEESTATQWVNQTNLSIHPVKPLSGNVPLCALLYYFTLSNTRQFYSSKGESWHIICILLI